MGNSDWNEDGDGDEYGDSDKDDGHVDYARNKVGT